MIAPIIEPPAIYRHVEDSSYQTDRCNERIMILKRHIHAFACTAYIDALRAQRL